MSGLAVVGAAETRRLGIIDDMSEIELIAEAARKAAEAHGKPSFRRAGVGYVAEVEPLQPSPLKACASCGAKGSEMKLKACKGCKVTGYCSRACQKSDWAQHRKVCKLMQRRQSAPGPDAADSDDEDPVCPSAQMPAGCSVM